LLIIILLQGACKIYCKSNVLFFIIIRIILKKNYPENLAVTTFILLLCSLLFLAGKNFVFVLIIRQNTILIAKKSNVSFFKKFKLCRKTW